MAEGNYPPRICANTSSESPVQPTSTFTCLISTFDPTHVPRSDNTYHSDGLLDRHVPEPRDGTRDRIPVVPHGFGREPFEEGGRVDVFPLGVCERFTVLGGLSRRGRKSEAGESD